MPCVPTSSTKPPVLGHSAMHVPPERKGVFALVQLRQSVLDAPLQVPHDASQATQTLLLLAYLATGVHDARQLPGWLKNGVADAQVKQSAAVGPEQVAQFSWQATHESAAEKLPPAHV